MRMIDSVERPAPSDQTMVDTHFGLTLEIRASSGLVAQAFTVLPSVVRSRNHIRATRLSGTSTKTLRSEP